MKRLLNFLRSMRFGMILLILVMLFSLVGSLIPQQEAEMTYVRAYGARGAMAILLLGFDDVFHTGYFFLLEGLLCANLILCSILRFPRTRSTMKRLQAETAQAGVEIPLSEEEAKTLRNYLQVRRYRESDGVYCRNADGAYGSFLTHLSILLVLLFGTLVLMTPEVHDETVMPGRSLTLEDGTLLTCESFHIQDASGQLDYASVLRAQGSDGQEKTQEIRVNEPMRFREYKIYQQTYGTAGQVRVANLENGAEDTVFLTDPCFLSIDGENGVYFNALYPGFIQDEDGNYTLITQSSGSYTDPVYAVQSISDGMSTSVLAFPGEALTIGQIRFTFGAPVEYPGLRIKRISSQLYGGLYFSFFLMVLALYLCFFRIPVCIRIQDDGFVVRSPKPVSGLMMEFSSVIGRKLENERAGARMVQGKE